MSRLAPTTDSVLRVKVNNVLRVVNKNAGADRFFAIKDDDPHNELAGNFLLLEAKNIFIAAIVSGVWDELVKTDEEFPDPATTVMDYNITTWHLGLGTASWKGSSA
ncbi:hypothetical protein LTR62_007386 [Meristemomyces frigidus]|uniref:Uncharacterized protein n=1 Tax=Meristemomyces frigidus TaxID=1508187 RepID=A0AAN7TQ34_9PEZI|nr:hypothetical protein LTR62_007386 [Meristemomyces frigidus]